MTTIPESHRALLDQPNIGHLATLRPDGSIQLNDMWFAFEGEHLRFTHTTTRRKFRNLLENPAMTLSVTDPGNPYRYIEVRGRLAETVTDPTGSYFTELNARYGSVLSAPPADAADRVILVMAIDKVNTR
ncbi:MAG: PPOX class F420-dependent oxidoreductase [Homoserinimonas sp.]